MRLATPPWLLMPVPKTESLATSAECVGSGIQRFGDSLATVSVFSRFSGTVTDVGPVLAADTLHDHIDNHARLGQFVEGLRGQAGNVGQADKGDHGLGLVEKDIVDDQLFQTFSRATFSKRRSRSGSIFSGAVQRRRACGRLGRLVQLERLHARCEGFQGVCRSISTEILISLVVIISILIPFSASGRNIVPATPC